MSTEKKDRLVIIQELFKEVGMQGDQAHAAKKAGFVSQVVSKALNKNSWGELTSGEITGLIELHKMLIKRKKDLAEIDAFQLNK